MFDRVGLEDGGYVVRTYRNANRAMQTALQEENNQSAVFDVMLGMKVQLRAELRNSFETAWQSGLDESARQLRYYNIETPRSRQSIDFTKQVDTAIDAVIAQVEAQEATIAAMLFSGVDQTLITGDEDRQGVLKPVDIVAGAAYWIGALVWDAFSDWSQTYSGGVFSKQSVAALDARVTECCAKVHGQIVPFNAKFELTGTPRFADFLEWTPFHWRCRTSIVLYTAEFDDGFTARMRSGANWLLNERRQGRNPDQHPADAFWHQQ